LTGGKRRCYTPAVSEPVLPERVVFVCATYLPRVTGVAMAMHAWARQLLSRGVRVSIVAPEYPPLDYYPLPSYPEGLEVVRLPSRPAPLASGIHTALARGRAWERLVTDLRGQRAIIHAQDLGVAGPLALTLGRRCALPVLLHAHYPIGEGDLTEWLPVQLGRPGRRAINATLRRLVERKARAVSRRAALVATVSPYMEHLLRRRGIAEPLVVPCAVDVPPQIPALDIRKRHAIPAESPVLLYAGRLDPDKGISALIDMAALLRQQEPRLRLLLVGGGPYLPRYVARAEALRLQESVLFAGWVPHHDLWAYFAQADLFVIANPHEAQGLVAIEAQSAGLPIVAYRGGGITLAVADGRTGVLTDPAPQALAAAALSLVRQRERLQAMRAAAPEQAAAFTSERVFPILLDAYQRARASTP